MLVSETAPAKINLTLDVLYKRPDDYHELSSVMTTIDLSDRVDVVPMDTSVIEVEMMSGVTVDNKKRNLAYKAAYTLQKLSGVKKGAYIRVNKAIPFAAGLGGGSSDAAATLRALNKLWGLGFSMDDLATIGLEIGSDIPFCVYAKTALATGRGEILRFLPKPPLCWVVLAKPLVGMSTSKVFNNLDLSEIHNEPQKNENLVNGLERGIFENISGNLFNNLEKVTMKLNPEVEVLKKTIKQLGADGVVMSGSGPSVYGLVKSERKARQIVNGLKGFCQNVFMIRLLG